MFEPTFSMLWPFIASDPLRKSHRPAEPLRVAPPPPNVASPARDPCARALYWELELVLTIAPRPSGPAPSTTTVRDAMRTASAASALPATSSAAPSSTTIRPSALANGLATLNCSVPSRTTRSPEKSGFADATVSTPPPVFSTVPVPESSGALAADALAAESTPALTVNLVKPEWPPLSSRRPPPFLVSSPAPDAAAFTFRHEAGLSTVTPNGDRAATSVPPPESVRFPPASPTPRMPSVSVCPVPSASSESPA